MSREILTAVFLCLSVASVGCNAEPAKTEPAAAKPSAEQHTPPAVDHSGAVAPGPDTLGHNPHAQPPAVAPPGPPRDVTPSGETREELVDGLKMMVPSEWVRVPGSGSMRKAEFTLPGPGGDVNLVVYRFEGGAGSTQQNIERWKQQIKAGEGTEAETSEIEAGGLKVTSLDVRGAYAGQSMPGAPPQPAVADARLLAAAIEGVGDPWYFKLVGPAGTIDVWSAAWTALLAELAPVA
jgi:hypothetical protein